MWTRYLSLLLAVLLLTGCGSKGSGMAATSDSSEVADSISGEIPAAAAQTENKLEAIHALGNNPEDNYRTWYEIFVYSFCDSDGDGIGDLQGVISKLDYLQDLGVTGIWLMPIHPSISYHKYDVKDYYDIDPAYGTLEDFDALIAQCNRRNIKVITDLVLNHTSNEHPWFLQAAEYLAGLNDDQESDVVACPYIDFYHFEKTDICPTGYHLVPGTDDWYYEGRFSPVMPDLNFESQVMRDSLKDIMEFWFARGVSGFRLDAAKEFYTGQTQKNVEVLNWIQTTARSINPECYLVAEVWDNFMALSEYYDSGITSLFNFAFGNSDGKISKVLRGLGDPSLAGSYAAAQEKADAAFRKHNPDYIDAPFFSNHDVGRIAGFVGRDENKTKLAAAMNLFMGGSAFIYYGEEIGMVAGSLDDPSYRAPMYWNPERDDGTTQPPPGCTLPESYPFGSLQEQIVNDNSIYNYYRQAIAIRNAIPAIARGIPTVEAALNNGCVSACRKTWNENACIILMNISETEETVKLDEYSEWKLATALSANGEEVNTVEGSLTLPAYGVAVLTPESIR